MTLYSIRQELLLDGAARTMFPTVYVARSKWKTWKGLYRHKCSYSSGMIKGNMKELNT